MPLSTGPWTTVSLILKFLSVSLVLPSGVVDRLDEDEEALLPNITSVCTEDALYGKFCDWVLEPKVDLMEVLCQQSDR